MSKQQLYFTLQFGGWLFYTLLAFLVLGPSEENTLRLLTILFLVFVTGIITTHLFRYFILKWEWNTLNISGLIPRISLSIIVLSIVFQFIYLLGFSLMFQRLPPADVETNTSNLVNWATLLLMWSIIYFAYLFFERYRVEEIKNLRWQASKNEIELNKLKSQLNPHFIFNSMNSIRALIDEDPEKAKKSVTQLANILRNTLMMGKKKTVSLEEELKVVHDYVNLEKTRYEDRLQFSEDISEESLSYHVPSLMVQTLIENGIKHGISKIPGGGIITLRTFPENDCLHIEIENSGSLDDNSSTDTGFGIINTTQRLMLLYGNNGKFSISNSPHDTVLTRVQIPKKTIL
jgi:sensor histidine kinase YesM